MSTAPVIVYDDSYGVVTESDLLEEAAQAFKAYEQEENANAGDAV